MSDSFPEDYHPPQFAETDQKPSVDTMNETASYGQSHTMFRIKDPKVSIPFYVQTLGMTLVHRSDSEKGKFTNYFLIYPGNGNNRIQVPSDPAEKQHWLWNQAGIIELCHNWNTENDSNFKYCNGNEAAHKGFGHICMLVDDLNKACERFEKLGVKFQKKPSEGTMRHIAFILDPDNYWIEVIARSGASTSGQKQGS